MSAGGICHYCQRAACECPEPAPFAILNDHQVTFNAGESVTLQPYDVVQTGPQGVVQAMIEEIKKLTAEVAAMKAVLQSRGFTMGDGKWARTEETV